MKRALALFTLGIFLFGCGQTTKEDQAVSPVNSADQASMSVEKTVDPATSGTLKGTVSFEGTVPAARELPVQGNPECSIFHKGKVFSEEYLVENGKVQNVFVYVKQGLESFAFTPPTTHAVIDNKNCLYSPRVMGVQVGQPVDVQNSDPTLHNVHSYSKTNKSFNLGLPFQGMKQTKKFTAQEIMVQMKCDVHPWMVGYIGVLDHPYFQVTGKDGMFELKNLPPGEYVVEAWHEKFGAQSQTVTVGDKEVKEINFSF
jgi:plastocyanin